MEMGNKPVEIELLDDSKLKLSYNDSLLNDHLLDYPSVPQEERGGQMRKLLSASALGCFTGSIYFTLLDKGAKVKSLKGSSVATSEKKDDEVFSRVTAIDIKIAIEIDDEDTDKLEEVRSMVKNGCLITGSIAPSIVVSHEIIRIQEKSTGG